MRAGYECIRCMVFSSLDTIERCTKDPEKRLEVGRKVISAVASENFNHSPVEISGRINEMIRKEMDNPDPYLNLKRERNKRALSIANKVRDRILRSPDPLYAAIMTATAGNILDTVAGDDNLLEESLDKIFKVGFKKDFYKSFTEILEESKEILYIADNSGEIIFDKLLVEELVRIGREVLFCVRGYPAVDDALEEDFCIAGLNDICKMIDTGTAYQGLILDEASEECRLEFGKAKLIIAKGMGNFETLADYCDSRIFFLLAAKCPRIADIAGVKTGDFCFLQGNNIPGLS